MHCIWKKQKLTSAMKGTESKTFILHLRGYFRYFKDKNLYWVRLAGMAVTGYKQDTLICSRVIGTWEDEWNTFPEYCWHTAKRQMTPMTNYKGISKELCYCYWWVSHQMIALGNICIHQTCFIKELWALWTGDLWLCWTACQCVVDKWKWLWLQ